MDNQFTSKNQAVLVVWILWAAMMGSLAVYVFVLPMLRQQTQPAPPEVNLPGILGMGALGAGMVSVILRYLLLGGFKRGASNFETVPGVRRFVVGNILCFALSEGVGIFGLVLGVLGYSLDSSAKFLMGSFALLLFHMPLSSRFRPE